MPDPLVSSLVICYNQAQFIEAALQSIYDQTYPTQEVLISDDASTDGSSKLICEWVRVHNQNFQKVAVWCQEENLGLKGRNNIKFISDQINPQSQYVQILECDDRWLPEKTQRCVEFLESHPQYGGVHGNFVLCRDGQETPQGWQALGVDRIEVGNVYEYLLRDNRVMTCTTMWRREVYQQAFDYSLFTTHNIILGDYAGTLRAARTNYLGYIEDDLAFYRHHSDSTVNKPETRHIIIEDTERVKQLARNGYI